MPSMETLEITKHRAVKSIISEFGDQDDEDIPDMADYEEPDNLVEVDAVSFSMLYPSKLVVDDLMFYYTVKYRFKDLNVMADLLVFSLLLLFPLFGGWGVGNVGSSVVLR